MMIFNTGVAIPNAATSILRLLDLAILALTGLAIFGSAGPARANFINIEEQSSRTLAFSLQLNDFSYSATLNIANIFSPGDSWSTGELPILFGLGTSDLQNLYPKVFWAEPDNPNKYNLLKVAPSGNRGTTTFDIFSDISLSDIVGGAGGCSLGGQAVNCPAIANGVPLTLPFAGPDTGTGDIVITFSDIADVAAAVPEPATWAMMIHGFFGLSLVAYRRRAKTALVAA